MKKQIIFMLFISCLFAVSAQDISKNTLGLRLGNTNGFGGEISYQRGLSSKNRLEIDLGFSNSDSVDAVRIVGLYQWVYDFESNFNWYVGAGGGFANSNNYKGFGNQKSNNTYLLAAGNIGVEYLFDFPLQVSLDLRPELGISNNNQYFTSGLGLGLRYRF